tara:strand:+ start:69 stop:299 length:231 start_codon:yes stop_codon:yes gene_type:complete
MVLIKPHKATHATLVSAGGKKAHVAIADLDCLEGVSGTLKWLKLTANSREILGTVQFDGQIERIESDYRKKRKPTG